MKETLTTISERTGFSITTISRVLSGKSKKYRISENQRVYSQGSEKVQLFSKYNCAELAHKQD